VVAVVVVMVLILVLAGLVVAYVAYPHRGEQMPAAPWLGEAMAKAVDAAPVLDGEDEEDEGIFGLDPRDEYQDAEPRR
jgi:hypothetical protein